MNQYTDQKELRDALNSKLFLQVGGIFIIVASFTSVMLGINFFMLAGEATKGNEELLQLMKEQSLSVNMLYVMGVASIISSTAEVVCGVFSVKLCNRLKSADFVFKMGIVLLVIEVLVNGFLVWKKGVAVTQVISAIIMPCVLLWASSRMKKLHEKYPDRIYAMEKKSGKQPAHTSNKSIMDRAKAQAKNDFE